MFKENQGEVLHGILLIVLFSFSAFYIAEFEFVQTAFLQPADCRYHLRHAIRQQLTQQTARNMGFRESSSVPNKSCAQV